MVGDGVCQPNRVAAEIGLDAPARRKCSPKTVAWGPSPSAHNVQVSGVRHSSRNDQSRGDVGDPAMEASQTDLPADSGTESRRPRRRTACGQGRPSPSTGEGSQPRTAVLVTDTRADQDDGSRSRIATRRRAQRALPGRYPGPIDQHVERQTVPVRNSRARNPRSRPSSSTTLRTPPGRSDRRPGVPAAADRCPVRTLAWLSRGTTCRGAAGRSDQDVRPGSCSCSVNRHPPRAPGR